jgi:small subunit ribosomal protein S14
LFHAAAAKLRAKMGKMAMDMLRRRMVRDAEVPRLVLKSIVMSSRLPSAVRGAAQRQLAEMSPNTSASRIRMRCTITGRPRAVFSDLKMSRIMLRDLASSGQLPGICKQR